MAARPTLAVGALRTSGDPVLMGSAILWDVDTGLSTTDAHVVLDCGTSNGTLDPEMHGVALGVGSADADIEWLWTARIVNISYPPSNKPSWPAKIASWSFTIAPGSPKLDLAVLQVQGHLNGAPFADVQSLNQSFAVHGLKAVPLGDSDSELAQVGSAVRVYGFGQSDSHRTQRAMITGGIVSRKTDDADGCCITVTIDAAMLSGHSGGMLLDSVGEVIGWCVWSQLDMVSGSGSLHAPSGANDVRPINLLRPALEAALVLTDPSRTGVTLTEKLRGAVPLRPVQDQASTAAEAALSMVQAQVLQTAQVQAFRAIAIAQVDADAARQKGRIAQQALGLLSGGHGQCLALQEPGEHGASQAVAASTAMGLSQGGTAAAMTSLPPDRSALQADDHKRQRFRSLPQGVVELSLAAPLLDGVPNLPEQYAPRPVLEAAHREALLRTTHTMAITATTTGVSGPAGAGKSTLSVVLARDPLVHAHFPDGVTWLSFGRERTGADVLRTLATSILRLDPALTHDQLPRAISAALAGQRRLLVLDDIWTREQLQAFASLAAEGGLLGRLVTTRSKELAGEHAQTVDALQEEEGLRVLASYMRTTAEVLQSDGAAKRLVELCCGNPAQLRSVAGLCREDGTSQTLQYLKECRKALADPELNVGEYGTLFDALGATIQRLGEPMAERCTMLSTFPEDTHVPLSVVGQLWGTNNIQTKKTVRKLKEWHLIDVDWDKSTLSLIDLHLDYLRASAKDDLALWHAALLRGCGRRKLGEDEDTADDAYWGGSSGRGPLVHHLRGCGRELTALGRELTHITLDQGRGQLLDQRLGDEGVKALSEAIKVSGSLKSLNMNLINNEIGDEGGKAIAEALAVNGSLTTLDLYGRGIGPEGGVAIAEALKVNGSLTKVSLRNNTIGDEGAKAIGAALAVNGSLTDLYLSDNQIGVEGAKAISATFAVNGSLTSLNLMGNKIGCEGGKAIADGLRVNDLLTSLGLCQSKIGDEGAKAIGEALTVNGSLTSLNLRDNGVYEEGAKAIGEALAVNGSLTILDLACNWIGDKGAKEIGAGLAVNDSLATLNLLNNNIGDAGAADIAEALKVNGSLTSLVLITSTYTVLDNEISEKAKNNLKYAAHARLQRQRILNSDGTVYFIGLCVDY